MFNFEITVGLNAVVVTNKRSNTQFLPMVTSYKAIIQHHNKNVDIDTIH